MRTIVRIRFGAHLYGTATPASDVDYKSVFIPSARDVLLQRVKGSISHQRPKAEGEKNYAGEVDEEAYSLQRYLGLCAEGQTVALDVLFAPPSSWVLDGSPSYVHPSIPYLGRTARSPSREWFDVVENRHRLITRKSVAFVGYCRQQANKYGIKGSRVAAAREALALLAEGLDRLGTVAKLIELEPGIAALTTSHERMALLDIEGATDVHGTKRTVRHWEVCNRKMPLTQTIKSAHEVMRRIVEEYGHRALQAESNQGVDWKALSHAVRVARQGIELLRTGEVVFPRPEAKHLTAIKLGQLPYAQVAEEIDDLLPAVEREAERSTLPESADLAWIDDFVADIYRNQINMEQGR